MPRQFRAESPDDLPEDLAHLTDLDIDAPIRIDATLAAALDVDRAPGSIKKPTAAVAGAGISSARTASGLFTPAFTDLPAYRGHHVDQACGRDAWRAGEGVQARRGGGRGGPAAAAMFHLPLEYVHGSPALSGAVYDCDDEDEAFVAAVHEGRIRGPQDVQVWTAGRGVEVVGIGIGIGGGGTRRGLQDKRKGRIEERSSISHGTAVVPPPWARHLTLPMVEASVVALEQVAWGRAGDAYLRAMQADARAAVASGRAMVPHVTALYDACTRSDRNGAETKGKGKRLAAATEAAASSASSSASSSRKRTRSSAEASDDVHNMHVDEDEGHVEGGAADHDAVLMHIDTFFVDSDVGLRSVRAASSALLSAALPAPTAVEPLFEVLYAWWLKRRRDTARLVKAVAGAPACAAAHSSGSSSSFPSLPCSSAVKGVKEGHCGYIIRAFHGLGPADVPADVDCPLHIIAFLATGMEPEQLAALAGAAAWSRAAAHAVGARAHVEEEEGEGEGEEGEDDDREQKSTRKRGPYRSGPRALLRAQMADYNDTARAVLQGRQLRAHLEKLRALLDLVRRREKLKRARLLAIRDAAVEAAGSSKDAASLPRADGIFEWSGQSTAGQGSVVAAPLESPGKGKGSQRPVHRSAAEMSMEGEGAGVVPALYARVMKSLHVAFPTLSGGSERGGDRDKRPLLIGQASSHKAVGRKQ